ncbi:MAG: hypothetical protein IKD80_05560 [Selenomonadaceae bacterium]|nr:hypothetical protein [Selenomonadaceae bacterium]
MAIFSARSDAPSARKFSARDVPDNAKEIIIGKQFEQLTTPIFFCRKKFCRRLSLYPLERGGKKIPASLLEPAEKFYRRGKLFRRVNGEQRHRIINATIIAVHDG